MSGSGPLERFPLSDELLYFLYNSDSDSSDSDNSDSDNSSDINELRKVLFSRKVMRKVERCQSNDSVLRAHIDKFLENGIPINTQDIKGDTILHFLFTIYNKIIYEDSEYLEIMTFVKLIKHYIEKGADKSIKNQDGLTPLEIAKNNDTYELLEKFI